MRFHFFPFVDYPFVRPHDAWKTAEMIKLHHFALSLLPHLSIWLSLARLFARSFAHIARHFFSPILQFVHENHQRRIIIRRLIDKFYVRFYFCLFSSVCRRFSCFDASNTRSLSLSCHSALSNLYQHFAT